MSRRPARAAPAAPAAGQDRLHEVLAVGARARCLPPLPPSFDELFDPLTRDEPAEDDASDSEGSVGALFSDDADDADSVSSDDSVGEPLSDGEALDDLLAEAIEHAVGESVEALVDNEALADEHADAIEAVVSAFGRASERLLQGRPAVLLHCAPGEEDDVGLCDAAVDELANLDLELDEVAAHAMCAHGEDAIDAAVEDHIVALALEGHEDEEVHAAEVLLDMEDEECERLLDVVREAIEQRCAFETRVEEGAAPSADERLARAVALNAHATSVAAAMDELEMARDFELFNAEDVAALAEEGAQELVKYHEDALFGDDDCPAQRLLAAVDAALDAWELFDVVDRAVIVHPIGGKQKSKPVNGGQTSAPSKSSSRQAASRVPKRATSTARATVPRKKQSSGVFKSAGSKVIADMKKKKAPKTRRQRLGSSAKAMSESAKAMGTNVKGKVQRLRSQGSSKALDAVKGLGSRRKARAGRKAEKTKPSKLLSKFSKAAQKVKGNNQKEKGRHKFANTVLAATRKAGKDKGKEQEKAAKKKRKPKRQSTASRRSFQNASRTAGRRSLQNAGRAAGRAARGLSGLGNVVSKRRAGTAAANEGDGGSGDGVEGDNQPGATAEDDDNDDNDGSGEGVEGGDRTDAASEDEEGNSGAPKRQNSAQTITNAASKQRLRRSGSRSSGSRVFVMVDKGGGDDGKNEVENLEDQLEEQQNIVAKLATKLKRARVKQQQQLDSN
jgi:hypothetical protein